jgi:hypothetical protein
MKDNDWLRKSFVLLKHPSLLMKDKKFIFVLGHMRSRSSVLSHVLGSHDEIIGYTELHRSYKSPLSLLKMKVDLYEEFGACFSGKYLLDKVLHNNLDPTLSVINKANPKIIFLLREPKGYAKSLIRLGKKLGNKRYATPEFAVKHYIERLNLLQTLPSLYDRPYFFIDSDKLITETRPILDSLAIYLELEKNISSDYKKFEKTGKIRHGDSSDNISTGSIKKADGKDKIIFEEEEVLTDDFLAAAIAAHASCKKILLSGASN